MSCGIIREKIMVTCRESGEQYPFYIDWIKTDDGLCLPWFNVCEQGCGSPDCNECVKCLQERLLERGAPSPLQP